MQHSLLPSSANSDSCEDEDSDRSSEKEEQEDPTDYCKGRAEVVQFCMVEVSLGPRPRTNPSTGSLSVLHAGYTESNIRPG